MAFNFAVNGRTTLQIKDQGDLLSAVFQIEYIKQAEGRTQTKCTMNCLKEMTTDDLSQQDKACLSACQNKLLTFYESFYSQTSVLVRKSMDLPTK